MTTPATPPPPAPRPTDGEVHDDLQGFPPAPVLPDKCNGNACIHQHLSCGSFNLKQWGCTLPVGHFGPHIACGQGVHNLEVWTDATRTPIPAEVGTEEPTAGQEDDVITNPENWQRLKSHRIGEGACPKCHGTGLINTHPGIDEPCTECTTVYHNVFPEADPTARSSGDVHLRQAREEIERLKADLEWFSKRAVDLSNHLFAVDPDRLARLSPRHNNSVELAKAFITEQAAALAAAHTKALAQEWENRQLRETLQQIADIPAVAYTPDVMEMADRTITRMCEIAKVALGTPSPAPVAVGEKASAVELPKGYTRMYCHECGWSDGFWRDAAKEGAEGYCDRCNDERAFTLTPPVAGEGGEG
jgi:hypothetical protein